MLTFITVFIDSSSEVQKSMTSIDRLRNDLLKNYDPQVIPKMNFSEKLTIKINLQCNHIKLVCKINDFSPVINYHVL